MNDELLILPSDCPATRQVKIARLKMRTGLAQLQHWCMSQDESAQATPAPEATTAAN